MTQIALREAMEQKGFASFRKLADALHRYKPKPKDLPEAHSLATYLGKLNTGDVGWFEKRGHIFDAICALLEVDRERLLPKKAVSPILHTFDAFPELRPLDLRTEDPVNLLDPSLGSADPLFGLPSPFSLFMPDAVGNDPAPASWIVAPRGAGARLWADACAARGLATCVRVHYLADALESPPDEKRRIILVREAQPERDVDACDRLAQLPEVTVIAPFVHPAVLRRESQNGPTTDRGFQTQPMRLTKWLVWTWTLRTDWLKQFLDWIAARLHGADSLFDAAKMLVWLRKIDPLHVLFPTPHDLLPLCARLHREGPRKLTQLTPKQLADHLFAEAIRPFPKERDGSLWLSAHARDLFQAMVDWKLRNLAVPFHSGLPKEKWLPAIPSSLLPSRRTEPEIQRALKKLRGKTAKERKNAEDELIEKTTSPDPHEALQLLAEAGLLGTEQRSGLTLRPAVCFVQWAREIIAITLRNGSPSSWGRWVLDSQRQDMIDQELDALSADELLRAIEKAVQSADPHDLGSVGAIEALFAAVGRRLQDAPSFRTLAAQHTNTLHALWHAANQCRRRRDPLGGGVLVPVTRVAPVLVVADWSRIEGWVANCWAWSLNLPVPPNDFLSRDPSWLWPGWCAVKQEDFLKLHFVGQWSANGNWQHPQTSSERLAAQIPEYLAKSELPPPSESIPSWLIPWFWIHIAEQDETTRPLVKYGSFGTEIYQLFLRLAQDKPESIRRRLATMFVSGIDASSLVGYLGMHRNDAPQFHRFLYELADWKLVCAGYAPQHAATLIPYLEKLPAAVVDWVLETLLQNHATDIESLIQRLFSRSHRPISSEQTTRLLTQLGLAREDHGWSLPYHLYRHSSSDALEVALELWKERPLVPSTGYWFTEAPFAMSIRGPLIDCLRDLESAERPEWVTRFLLTTLPIAGDRADEVFQLAMK